MRNELHKLANNAEYDIVLIDLSSPNFNIVTKNAIVASEQILIPAKPDHLSTLGIDYLRGSVRSLISEFNEYAELDSGTDNAKPEFLGVIFTMIQVKSGEPISVQKHYISQTKRLGVPIFKSNFRENKTIFADAPQN